jgi:formamidopyrimidine-DNA glycosylase
MKKKSKQEMVLIHLQMYGKITSWEAINKFRATRLSAIIFNLRNKGHIITSVNKRNENTGTVYAEYILHKETDDGQLNLV